VKLQRFYLADRIPTDLQIGSLFEVPDADLVNQLKRVFRFHVGDTIIVFGGDGQDHQCFIQEFQKDSVTLKLEKSYPSRFMPVRDLGREIWLCAAVVKKDTFEWIAEKATELGVSHILPIMAERSEKKSLNMERLEKIVIEASEQSGRGDVPTIHPIVGLEESIDFIRKENPAIQMVAFHTEGKLVQDDILTKESPIAVFIGPEGGWSEREVEMFHRENIPVVCLGKQVLRAETAVLAVLAKTVF
jgi:16S rRNA (uracil1498-N3)-methyltransferase